MYKKDNETRYNSSISTKDIQCHWCDFDKVGRNVLTTF